eukprot:187593-Heterocapsa_arctica.AAC.1
MVSIVDRGRLTHELEKLLVQPVVLDEGVNGRIHEGPKHGTPIGVVAIVPRVGVVEAIVGADAAELRGVDRYGVRRGA